MWSPSQAGSDLPDFGGSNSASEASWRRGQCPHETSSGTKSLPLPGPLPHVKGTSAHTHTPWISPPTHTHTHTHTHSYTPWLQELQPHSPDLRLPAFLPRDCSPTADWDKCSERNYPRMPMLPPGRPWAHRVGAHTSTSPGSPSARRECPSLSRHRAKAWLYREKQAEK